MLGRKEEERLNVKVMRGKEERREEGRREGRRETLIRGWGWSRVMIWKTGKWMHAPIEEVWN